MRNISFIVSAVALAFSVIATCIAAYRTPVLSFDYQGVIVGMLSALVTVLVGWQIFMAQRKISGDKLFLLLLHHGTV